MRYRPIAQSLVFLALLQSMGCLPATITVMPRISGRVVDSLGRPLAEAEVSIARTDKAPNGHSSHVTANQEGRFRRDEETRWTLAPVLPVDFVSDFVAVASFHGSCSVPVRFGGNITNFHFLGLTNKSEAFELADLVIETQPGPILNRPELPAVNPAGKIMEP